MKGEHSKIILVYILMLLVVGLVIALTFVILNNNSNDEHNESTANNRPTVDVNPYPNISSECTFILTLDEYNALTGPMCKGGYSRYDVTGLNIDGKELKAIVIYSDQNGNKAGLYINDRKNITKIDNVSNIKFGVYDNKLFVLDNNNNESNVLAFTSDSTKVYDLKESLESSKISDPAFQNYGNATITSSNVDPASFVFTDANFTFKTKLVDSSNQTISGSTYQVTFSGKDFSKPTFVTMN